MKILWHMPTLSRSMCGLSIRALKFAQELARYGHDLTFAVADSKADVHDGGIGGIPVLLLHSPIARPIHWSLQARARRRTAVEQLAAIDYAHDMFISCQPEMISAYRRRHPETPCVFVCGGTTILHDRADVARSADAGPLQRLSFKLDRRLKRSNERQAFKNADAIVFDSESTCRRVIASHRIPFRNCNPILGGVDAAFHRPPTADERNAARLALGIAPHEIIALWTGRISPEKNLDVLLDGLAFCKSPPDRLLIVGDGVGRAALASKSTELNLNERVRFVGPAADVRPFLWAADLFVFPSISESFGGSLAEAMACGLPCIALQADEVTIQNASIEILLHGNCGVLVERNEPSAFAEALDRLASDSGLRRKLGDRAALRAASDFTWRQAGRRLNELLERIARLKDNPESNLIESAPAVAAVGAAVCD